MCADGLWRVVIFQMRMQYAYSNSAIAPLLLLVLRVKQPPCPQAEYSNDAPLLTEIPAAVAQYRSHYTVYCDLQFVVRDPACILRLKNSSVYCASAIYALPHTT